MCLVIGFWLEMIKDLQLEFDAIIGIPTAGIPFSALLSLKLFETEGLNIPVLLARKHDHPGSWLKHGIIEYASKSFTTDRPDVKAYIGGKTRN